MVGGVGEVVSLGLDGEGSLSFFLEVVGSWGCIGRGGRCFDLVFFRKRYLDL